jgi:hypothetical protein
MPIQSLFRATAPARGDGIRWTGEQMQPPVSARDSGDHLELHKNLINNCNNGFKNLFLHFSCGFAVAPVISMKFRWMEDE